MGEVNDGGGWGQRAGKGGAASGNAWISWLSRYVGLSGRAVAGGRTGVNGAGRCEPGRSPEGIGSVVVVLGGYGAYGAFMEASNPRPESIDRTRFGGGNTRFFVYNVVFGRGIARLSRLHIPVKSDSSCHTVLGERYRANEIIPAPPERQDGRVCLPLFSSPSILSHPQVMFSRISANHVPSLPFPSPSASPSVTSPTQLPNFRGRPLAAAKTSRPAGTRKCPVFLLISVHFDGEARLPPKAYGSPLRGRPPPWVSRCGVPDTVRHTLIFPPPPLSPLVSPAGTGRGDGISSEESGHRQ